MPQFQLNGVMESKYTDLSEFAQGYIECAFFTAPRPDEAGNGEGDPCPNCETELESGDDDLPYCPQWGCDWSCGEIPESFGIDNLSDNALQDIIKETDKFWKENQINLDRVLGSKWNGSDNWGDYDEAQAGRDFWFTRCGHGVGFWDRGFIETYASDAADSLSEAANKSGNVDMYLGDDSQIYFM